MKVIKQPSLYQCEICGSIYRNKSFAVFCEGLPLYKTNYKIGDTVYVESRYDGLIQTKIVELKITQPMGLGLADTMTSRPSDTIKERLTSHYMLAIVEDKVEICKNGTKSNEFYIQELRKKE
jgi:hypothetical protein